LQPLRGVHDFVFPSGLFHFSFSGVEFSTYLLSLLLSWTRLACWPSSTLPQISKCSHSVQFGKKRNLKWGLFRIFNHFKGKTTKERKWRFFWIKSKCHTGPGHTNMRRSTHRTHMLKSSISDFHFIKISN